MCAQDTNLEVLQETLGDAVTASCRCEIALCLPLVARQPHYSAGFWGVAACAQLTGL